MDLYKETAHRPIPLPPNNWIMRQSWRNALFLHWPVHPNQLQPLLPSSVVIDTYEGSAWIGIVAFWMKGIYFRGIPFLSVIPPFAEMNVRTYVRYNGKPGVFFITLDVGDWASLNIAKKWYRLPYHTADVQIQQTGSVISYTNARKYEPVFFEGSCTPASEVFFPKEGTLDHFLTEKYCFYTTKNKQDLYHGDIHHQPWPLQKAEIEIGRNTLLSTLNIRADERPIAHFSKGVDSLMWNVKKL